MRTLVIALLSAVLAQAGPAAAPERECGRNAALGYWMAMAQMENTDAPAELSGLLERTARGDAAWDERLAPFVDANAAALGTMQRAAREPFCDWGLEYARGAEAPIAHLVRARALARLNVLYGIELLQRSRPADAAAAWAAGLRFSRDIAVGAPLLGALYSSNQLQAHMRAIEAAVVRRQLGREDLAAVEQFVASLPEDGFDWAAAVDVELGGVVSLQQRVTSDEDPVALLRGFVATSGEHAAQDRAVAAYLGVPVDRLASREAVRRAAERGLAAMTALRPQVVAAFRLPHAQSVPAVRDLLAKTRLDPTLAQGWPSMAKANEDSRAGLVKARASLIAALRAL